MNETHDVLDDALLFPEDWEELDEECEECGHLHYDPELCHYRDCPVCEGDCPMEGT